MLREETRTYLDAIGWVLLSAGAIWLMIYFGILSRVSGLNETPESYIRGVWDRSLGSPFQRFLLAGLVSLPLHFIWVFAWRGVDFLAAYEEYGGWAQTVFTSLGFLGTVIGVSLAVAGLSSAMSDGDPSELIGGLSTAFDTTFIGLSAAVLLLFLRKIARLW